MKQFKIKAAKLRLYLKVARSFHSNVRIYSEDGKIVIGSYIERRRAILRIDTGIECESFGPESFYIPNRLAKTFSVFTNDELVTVCKQSEGDRRLFFEADNYRFSVPSREEEVLPRIELDADLSSTLAVDESLLSEMDLFRQYLSDREFLYGYRLDAPPNPDDTSTLSFCTGRVVYNRDVNIGPYRKSIEIAPLLAKVGADLLGRIDRMAIGAVINYMPKRSELLYNEFSVSVDNVELREWKNNELFGPSDIDLEFSRDELNGMFVTAGRLGYCKTDGYALIGSFNTDHPFVRFTIGDRFSVSLRAKITPRDGLDLDRKEFRFCYTPSILGDVVRLARGEEFTLGFRMGTDTPGHVFPFSSGDDSGYVCGRTFPEADNEIR